MNIVSLKSCKIKRVFVFVSILFSLCASYSNAYFVRGALYKKGDKIVVVLSDFHLVSDQTDVQRDALISELDKFDKESSVILVEDILSESVHIDHKAYQQSRKDVEKIIVRLREGGNLIGGTPLKNLEFDLKKKGFKVENVESGYMRCQLMTELSTFKYSNVIPKIGIGDIGTEAQEQLKELNKQASEIYKYRDLFSKEEFKVVEDYFEKALKYIRKGFEGYCKFIYEWFFDYGLNHLSNIPEIMLDCVIADIMNNMVKYNHEIFRTTDSNIVFDMIKNNDKKVKVICAGYIHGSRAEGFLSDMGYELIKDTGVDCLNSDPEVDMKFLCQCIQNQNRIPINITELFKSFDIKNIVSKKVIGTEEERFNFGKNNFKNSEINKKIDEICSLKDKQKAVGLEIKILKTKSSFEKELPALNVDLIGDQERKKEIELSEINKKQEGWSCCLL